MGSGRSPQSNGPLGTSNGNRSGNRSRNHSRGPSRLLASILLTLLTTSCSLYTIPSDYTSFTIRAGNFYCDNNTYPVYNSDELDITGRFEADNVYYHGTDDQWDWNKLVGFYYPPFGLGIHEDSARLVWRYNTELMLFELGYYCYVEGSREGHSGLLGRVALGEEYRARIEDHPTYYRFTFGSGEPIDVPKTRFEATRYFCKPYFGGTTPSPHTMEIRFRSN